jgi:hypothetical protein
VVCIEARHASPHWPSRENSGRTGQEEPEPTWER